MSKLFTNYKEPKNREEYIDFLKNHYRYFTMNSWNRSTSYANNVKIYNLDLTDEQKDKAYEFLCDDNIDTTEYQLEQMTLFSTFYMKTGYNVGFNGRSSGYLVLYDTQTEYKDGKRNTHTYPGRSIDADEDFEDWDTDDIISRYILVEAFDKLCDELRDLLINYIDNAEIQEHEYTITKVYKTLTLDKSTHHMAYKNIEFTPDTEDELQVILTADNNIKDINGIADDIETYFKENHNDINIYTDITTDNLILIHCDDINFNKHGIDLLKQIHDITANYVQQKNIKVSVKIRIYFGKFAFKRDDGTTYNYEEETWNEFIKHITNME